VPLEAAEEEERNAFRERDWNAARERANEEAEDTTALENEVAGLTGHGDDSSVEEVEDALPLCPPPSKYTNEEKEAWVETVAYIKICRKEEIKVPIKVPSEFHVKWSQEQMIMWTLANAEVKKLQASLNVGWRRAVAREATLGVKRERTGHAEKPEAVATYVGKAKSQPSKPPLTTHEKARLVHCVACYEFCPCVEVMLRGVMDR
jgi:hypothetical protein